MIFGCHGLHKLYIKFSDGVPGGAIEPLCPARDPSLCGVLTAAGSNVCANFQEFLTMLSPPKMPWIVKKNTNKNIAASSNGGLKPSANATPVASENCAQWEHALQ